MTRESSNKDSLRGESDQVAAHFQQDQQKQISHCGGARHHSNFAQMEDSLNSRKPKNQSRLAKTKALIDLLTAAAWVVLRPRLAPNAVRLARLAAGLLVV